ncbi:hypothetical protein VaNZ11_013153, partial [Volvox africanus]
MHISPFLSPTRGARIVPSTTSAAVRTTAAPSRTGASIAAAPNSAPPATSARPVSRGASKARAPAATAAPGPAVTSATGTSAAPSARSVVPFTTEPAALTEAVTAAARQMGTPFQQIEPREVVVPITAF